MISFNHSDDSKPDSADYEDWLPTDYKLQCSDSVGILALPELAFVCDVEWMGEDYSSDVLKWRVFAISSYHEQKDGTYQPFFNPAADPSGGEEVADLNAAFVYAYVVVYESGCWEISLNCHHTAGVAHFCCRDDVEGCFKVLQHVYALSIKILDGDIELPA